jgi:site-specific recombinase XerD
MAKGKLIQLTGLVLQQQAVSPPLPEKDAELCLEIIQAYRRRRESLRHTEKSISSDFAVIDDFLKFAGLPFWLCTEEDFEAWCSNIGTVKMLAVATQRHYQGVIRGIFGYIVENQRFPEKIRQLCGLRIRQICTDENCIPHIQDRELSKERDALIHEEVDMLFEMLERAAKVAKTFASKDLYPLLRDKAMFFLIYIGGFRISEVIGMNVGSFQPNPQVPMMGDYGFASVWRKGSRGSGKVYQAVPITDARLPPMMEWYLKKIRPKFLVNADPNETALFLSERGKRIAKSTLENRFQHAMALAGLEGRNFTPHCLRHSSVTHGSMILSLEANRIKHGHKHASTTQGYTHLPDKYVADDIANAIKFSINQVNKNKETDK